MPLIRIDLMKGKSADHIRAISDGVHKALVETYQVPPGDRFHLITQHEPEEVVYDPDYLGIHRSDDLVFVHVFAGNWRDTKAKQGFYKRLAELLATAPGLRPEDVQVVISSNERDEWSLGGGRASYVKESDAQTA